MTTYSIRSVSPCDMTVAPSARFARSHAATSWWYSSSASSMLWKTSTLRSRLRRISLSLLVCEIWIILYAIRCSRHSCVIPVATAVSSALPPFISPASPNISPGPQCSSRAADDVRGAAPPPRLLLLCETRALSAPGPGWIATRPLWTMYMYSDGSPTRSATSRGLRWHGSIASTHACSWSGGIASNSRLGRSAFIRKNSTSLRFFTARSTAW